MSERLRSVSPVDPSDELGLFEVADTSQVAGAVARAKAAFPPWRDAGFEVRKQVLNRFRDVVRKRQGELANLIARETGKALWEAASEAALVPAKVDVTLGEGMRAVAPMEPVPGARATFHPRGVLAVLGPFNFPAHLPGGHIIPALALGNSVVLKPSELTPAVGQWLVDALRSAGTPDGVVEIVHGAAPTGSALASHPDVRGILFTGSWAAGRALQEAILDQPDKILALEMGGRNAMVVLADANLELAVAEAALSIAATTGQRCSALSRIFVEKPVLASFSEGLARVLGGLRIGRPLDSGVFMGPLISEQAHQRATGYRDMAEAAGGDVVLEVDPELPVPFLGPRLVHFDGLDQAHAYQRDEIFAPEAALYAVDDLDQAISAVNDCDFGLVASVMTRTRSHYEYCRGRIETGLLNWNRGTIGASGRLPFGGLKCSGNDRPAGILAGVYCSFVQSHLEHDGGLDPAALPPGFPRP
jgi:succinylglutamic semialdehyde dehydrogenase